MLGTTAHSQEPSRLRIAKGAPQIEYCDNDADLAMATIRVKVKFTNTGKQNLILSRQFGPDEHIELFDMSGVLVYSPHPSYYESERPQLGDAPNPSVFETVTPDASVVRELTIGIPITKNPTHTVDFLPSAASYRVSASVSTRPFYGDETRAKQVREKWASYGTLVTRRIALNKITVQLRLPPQIPVCKPDCANEARQQPG